MSPAGLAGSAGQLLAGSPHGQGYFGQVTGDEGFELATDGPKMIVVGLDGSRTSWRAASYANGLARRQHSRVTVVYVASPGALAATAAEGAAVVVIAEAREELGADLRRQVERLARERGVDTDFRVAHGDPFTELRNVARQVHADALVVGASERVGHRFVGSLAARLVKAGLWPVTVVP